MIFDCLGVKIVVLKGDESVENNFVGFDQQTGGAGQKDKPVKETSPELRMLSSVTLYFQVTKIVMKSGSQFFEL